MDRLDGPTQTRSLSSDRGLGLLSFIPTCILTVLLLMTVSLDLMSTPMVEMKLFVLESSKNLSSKQDFPTPESPT